MTLTPAQQALIEKPFALNEHGFKGQHVYLLKSALRRRLNEVDRDWHEGKPELLIDTDPDVVSIALPLTVAGVTRMGVGVGIINRWITNEKTGEITGELEGFKLALEKSKARKSAATDALTRAFNEFNGAAYLKDKPNSVKKDGFPDWLAKLSPAPVAVHWADNGGRQRVAVFLARVGLEWAAIKDIVEPGKTLALLNETTLDEAAFMVRLAEIAFKPATPQTPPPAPTPASVQPPRYGDSSATTSTPVAPAIATPAEAPIDLHKYFSESSPEPTTTAPASPDPLNKAYASPYERRPVVRSVSDPTGRNTRIGYIKCLPIDLDTNDIILTADGPRTIIAAYPPEQGERRFLLKDAAGEEHDYKLTLSLVQAEIVGGPKLAAVQDNPDLAPPQGPHRLWRGTQKNVKVAS